MQENSTKTKILLNTFFVHHQDILCLYNHFYKWFVSGLNPNKFEVRFLMNEEDFVENQKTHDVDILNPILLPKKSVEYIFQECDDINYVNLYNKIHYEKLNDSDIQRFKEVTNEILGDWEPDIIMYQSYVDTKAVWGKIFPNALYLTTDNSIFSRPPFARAVVYDPFNTTPYSFLTRFENEIKNFKISKWQNLQVNKFKYDLKYLIKKYSKIKQEMTYYKTKFKKTLLLPLAGDLSSLLFRDCICSTDKELVDYVMQKVPSNVGVFVTQGDTIYNLTEKDIEYFSNKYPNFIFLSKTDEKGYVSNSLYYYQYVDAVFNTLSKTALTAALIYDMPIIALTKNYNNLIVDIKDINSINDRTKFKRKTRNNILYWYLTHYIIYEQSLIKDTMEKALEKMLNSYRENKNNITFEFYPQIYTMKEASDYVIPHVCQYYGYITLSEKLNNVLNLIKNKLILIKNKIVMIFNKIKECIKYVITMLIKFVLLLYKISKYYIITK